MSLAQFGGGIITSTCRHQTPLDSQHHLVSIDSSQLTPCLSFYHVGHHIPAGDASALMILLDWTAWERSGQTKPVADKMDEAVTVS